MGAALLGVGVAALTLRTSWGGTEYPWRLRQIVGLAVLSMLAPALFVARERRLDRRGHEPILSLSLFCSRKFAAAIAITFLVGFAMFGAVKFLPQFQQNVQAAQSADEHPVGVRG